MLDNIKGRRGTLPGFLVYIFVLFYFMGCSTAYIIPTAPPERTNDELKEFKLFDKPVIRLKTGEEYDGWLFRARQDTLFWKVRSTGESMNAPIGNVDYIKVERIRKGLWDHFAKGVLLGGFIGWMAGKSIDWEALDEKYETIMIPILGALAGGTVNMLLGVTYDKYDIYRFEKLKFKEDAPKYYGQDD